VKWKKTSNPNFIDHRKTGADRLGPFLERYEDGSGRTPLRIFLEQVIKTQKGNVHPRPARSMAPNLHPRIRRRPR
jgi:hypothetical protein